MEARMLVELVQHDQGRFDHYAGGLGYEVQTQFRLKPCQSAAPGNIIPRFVGGIQPKTPDLAFGSIRLDPGVNDIEISINSF